MDLEFCDTIVKKICQLYKDLPKKGKPTEREWTTFASIIKTEDKDIEIITLTSGTKCIGQNSLSKKGDLISDSHAEVLSRRAFLLYLYSEIENCYQNSNKKSIFYQEKKEDSKDKNSYPKFILRPEIKFHLFVSIIPCGDAAIISKLKNDEDDEEVPEAKKIKLENENRTGAKIQQLRDANDYYENVQQIGVTRIKPGRGDPTLSMSCSDKISKWHFMGLQGSLLSNFILNPIRLNSIIIGSNASFSHDSLSRALFLRFKNQNLQNYSNYNFPNDAPIIIQSSFNLIPHLLEINTNTPAPGSIIFWMNRDIKNKINFNLEVLVNGRLSGVTKKNFGKPISRAKICRLNLFSNFAQLCSILKNTDDSNANYYVKNKNYEQVKKINKDYNEIWDFLKKNIMINWSEKPAENKLFTLED